MSKHKALDALTEPNPNERQKLIMEIASDCERRFRYQPQAQIDDVCYVLIVAEHWNFTSKEAISNYGRKAVGNLLADIRDAWDMLIAERRAK